MDALHRAFLLSIQFPCTLTYTMVEMSRDWMCAKTIDHVHTLQKDFSIDFYMWNPQATRYLLAQSKGHGSLIFCYHVEKEGRDCVRSPNKIEDLNWISENRISFFWGKIIEVRDVKGEEIARFILPSEIQTMCWFHDAKVLVVTVENQLIILNYDESTGFSLQVHHNPRFDVEGICWHPSGEYICVDVKTATHIWKLLDDDKIEQILSIPYQRHAPDRIMMNTQWNNEGTICLQWFWQWRPRQLSIVIWKVENLQKSPSITLVYETHPVLRGDVDVDDVQLHPIEPILLTLLNDQCVIFNWSRKVFKYSYGGYPVMTRQDMGYWSPDGLKLLILTTDPDPTDDHIYEYYHDYNIKIWKPL